MKKPWLAFLLNFLLAGAGFVYLGKWTWAAINFFGAIAVGLAFAHYAPGQLGIVSAAVGALSGGLAKSAAQSMNAKQKLQAAPTQPQS
jgi:uncharacterized membrane protein YjjP (DUF1212 family)